MDFPSLHEEHWRRKYNVGIQCHCMSHPQPFSLISPNAGTFRLYDTNHDGYISREEMESVVNSIHKMVGHMVTLEESAPQKRVDMLFEKMDLVSQSFI